MFRFFDTSSEASVLNVTSLANAANTLKMSSHRTFQSIHLCSCPCFIFHCLPNFKFDELWPVNSFNGKMFDQQRIWLQLTTKKINYSLFSWKIQWFLSMNCFPLTTVSNQIRWHFFFVYFTFTFSHLADAFIQSDLQMCCHGRTRKWEETAPLQQLLLGCGMVYLIISGSASLLESLNNI